MTLTNSASLFERLAAEVQRAVTRPAIDASKPDWGLWKGPTGPDSSITTTAGVESIPGLLRFIRAEGYRRGEFETLESVRSMLRSLPPSHTALFVISWLRSQQGR